MTKKKMKHLDSPTTASTRSTNLALDTRDPQCRVVIDNSPMATTPKDRRVVTSLDLSVNRGLVMLPEFQANTEWSGPLAATRGTNARAISLKIVENAHRITESLDIGNGKDQSDDAWDPRVPILEVRSYGVPNIYLTAHPLTD